MAENGTKQEVTETTAVTAAVAAALSPSGGFKLGVSVLHLVDKTRLCRLRGEGSGVGRRGGVGAR